MTYPFISSYKFNVPVVPRFITNSIFKPVLTNILAGSLALNQIHPVSASTLSAPIVTTNRFVINAAEYAQVVGSYSDPNHPGCKRLISFENNEVVISGSDELDGSNPFRLIARTQPDGSLIIDFSPKGGPKDLKGKKESNLFELCLLLSYVNNILYTIDAIIYLHDLIAVYDVDSKALAVS